MLKEHHGQATQKRVVQRRVNASGPPSVGNRAEGCRQEVKYSLPSQTL